MQGKLDHLEHLEDLLFTKGKDFTIDYCNRLHKAWHTDDVKVTIKYDGKPAIIFGYQDDKFFVATKSFFNKTPKLNFTVEDIHRNHAGKENLIYALEKCLKKLPDLCKNDGVLYQGDLLFTDRDLGEADEKGFRHCTPNVIEYPVHAADCHDLGLSVHTSYRYDSKGKLVQIPLTWLGNRNAGVLFSIYIPPLSANKHQLRIPEFNHLMWEEGYDDIFLEEYALDFKRYYNYCIRNELGLSLPGFIIYVLEKEDTFTSAQYAIDLLKDAEKIDDILQLFAALHTFKMHIWQQHSNYHEHEGLVIEFDGLKTKIVDRRNFSFKNFKKND